MLLEAVHLVPCALEAMIDSSVVGAGNQLGKMSEIYFIQLGLEESGGCSTPGFEIRANNQFTCPDQN